MPRSEWEKPDLEHCVFNSQRCWATPVPRVQDDDKLNACLLWLAELKVPTRHGNALKAWIKQARFSTIKDLDSFDFTVIAPLNKQQVLDLTRPKWINQHYNACFIGNSGTGKTHVVIGLDLASCRQQNRVRFFTAASLVTQLEEDQKQYQLD